MKSYRADFRVFWVPIICALSTGIAAAQSPSTLTGFSSESELIKFLEDLRKELSAPQSDGQLQFITVTAQKREEAITSTQTEGIDEGGLVKLHGDHLVVLRRGRLFSISLRGGKLKPVSWVDAFGPGMNPEHSWYDELLIYQDRIIVIGYSYERGGTELGFFRIDDSGYLTYQTTFHLRSGDYYSSRNYASRLTEGRLILYSPLSVGGADDALPGIREWPAFGEASAGSAKEGFTRIADASRIFKPARPLRPGDYPVLHTVTTCDLGERIDCRSVSAFGTYSSVFFVSTSAVYVWLADWSGLTPAAPQPGFVYRMPLNGRPPTAMQVAGSPTDQFSFHEDKDDYLNVLVRAEAEGDAMWAAERSSGNVALFRTPLAQFGDGSKAPDWSQYLAVPSPPDGRFQNRFVGKNVLYGTAPGWADEASSDNTLYVVNKRSREITSISLPHAVDRIEEMGADALVAGTDNDRSFTFSGIRLLPTPIVMDRHSIPDAAQAETRSHAFAYRADRGSSGTLALPIISGVSGTEDDVAASARVFFMRRERDKFHPLGDLRGTEPGLDREGDSDRCMASCVDWYGDSRPLFLGHRIFAMVGYEIIEGAIENGRIMEVARTSFMPFVER